MGLNEYLAVGVDVTSVFKIREAFPDKPETWDWHVIFTGRDPVPMPEALFQVWRRGQRSVVPWDDIYAALQPASDFDTRKMMDDLFNDFAFVSWPWHYSGSLTLVLYHQMYLTGSPYMPNPERKIIPNKVWYHKPTMALLEQTLTERGLPLHAARRQLVRAVPFWLAAIPSLHFEVAPPFSMDKILADLAREDAEKARRGRKS